MLMAISGKDEAKGAAMENKAAGTSAQKSDRRHRRLLRARRRARSPPHRRPV
jgi:hypothetical protein